MAMSGLNTEHPGVAGPLGRNVRRAREAAGLTQEGVASRCGVHATEVSRIEAGKRDPRVTTVERLAKALGVSASDLLR
jgi:transcriptional regulator with XRE-family HTH domain